ncbi:C-C chemokine receptor-like 2 [Apodemus sylvaticus]|uniref:C-C chemokine receptor-like 2 n=1 Tax=Apodemus sylvaticus TaxID=10129 RepID=UPI002242F033|nr:C-C chemokine receptor-like 2 [Apodemus sylvaticus]XP_052043062.1 C-C chemokine receptor-like 2 [Apodemus sylvaticus]
MDNYTVAPEDEYDVLIEDDLDISGTDQVPTPEFLSAQQVLQFCCVVFAVGLLENGLVVLVLVRYKGLGNLGNIYFLNLALSNLCFLLPLPFWAHAAAHGESPGNATCKVLVGLHSAGLYSETLSDILLLVQGYRAFSRGRLSSIFTTVSGGIVACALAWVVATALSLPESVFYEPRVKRQNHRCGFGKPHFLPIEAPLWKYVLTLKMNILVLAFPLLVFIFCFSQMRKMQRFRERRCDLRKPALIITGMFLLMWAPYNIVLFLCAFQEHLSLQNEKSRYLLDASVQVTQLIATTHCCVNPLLYLLLDKAFMSYLRSVFPRCNDIPFQSSRGSQPATSREDHGRPLELYSTLHQRQDI